jgi:hypothetical protein
MAVELVARLSFSTPAARHVVPSPNTNETDTESIESAMCERIEYSLYIYIYSYISMSSTNKRIRTERKHVSRQSHAAPSLPSLCSSLCIELGRGMSIGRTIFERRHDVTNQCILIWKCIAIYTHNHLSAHRMIWRCRTLITFCDSASDPCTHKSKTGRCFQYHICPRPPQVLPIIHADTTTWHIRTLDPHPQHPHNHTHTFTHTDTDTHTYTQTQRHTDIPPHRHRRTHTHTHTDRQTDTHWHTQTQYTQ